jgi:hypothetical protein
MMNGYKAVNTVQITEPTEPISTLKIHEMRPDGTPLCGEPAQVWEGIQLVYTPLGPGIVDCQRCARKA